MSEKKQVSVGGAGRGDEVELTKVSWPCGRTMVFSRLLITILHSSFRTRFRTVFSHTAANRVNLHTHTHTHTITLKQGTDSDHLPYKWSRFMFNLKTH